jgi:dephospho-CoA kinase
MTRTLIGLTGGIGSGKSTVAACWASLGAAVVDVDALAHGLTARGGSALPAIVDAFGGDMIGADGAMDRDAMRRRVLDDRDSLRRLESILHPLIERGALAQMRAADAPVTVFDVPLLVESRRWRARVDRVLVVDCQEDTQVARVIARSGWTEDQVKAMMARQSSRSVRRHVADAVIYNDGLGVEALRAEVHALWQAWVLATPSGVARAPP